MSAPRYRVTLEVEDARVTIKLNSVVGDACAVASELDSDTLTALAEQVAARWAAAASMCRSPSSSWLPHAPPPTAGAFLCDTCGISFSEDTIHTVVETDNLAGIVMCQECRV